MVGAVRDMGCDRTHRISVTVTVLDLCPAHCISIVTCPDLREEAQYAEIESVAARSAPFEKNVRELLCKFSHYPVKTQNISVRYFALSAGRKRS